MIVNMAHPLCWTFLLITAVSWCLRADDVPEPSVLWEHAVAAKGGRAVLHKVTALQRPEHMEYQHLGVFRKPIIEAEYLFAFPDRVWLWDDQRSTVFGLSIVMENLTTGERYLAYPNEQQARRLKGKGWASFWLLSTQAAFLLETKWTQPKPIRIVSSNSHCKKCLGLETSVNANRVDYFFDRSTFLPRVVKVYYPSDSAAPGASSVLDPKVRATFEFFDYQDVAGVKLPHRWTETTHVTVKVKGTYQINPEYGSQLFTSPPSVEAGKGGWRPKKALEPQ